MTEAMRMVDLEQKVNQLESSVNNMEERVEASTVQVNESLKVLTDNVNRLCERDIRMNERKKFDDAWKKNIEDGQKENARSIQNIVDERNKESQSRAFIMKWWPILLVVATVASGYIGKMAL